MDTIQAEYGFDLPSSQTNPLLLAALHASKRGWSVIPLLGGDDPSYGKRPRIRWESFTYHRADEQQIQTWFADKPSAYGVVCGSIYGLIVLDFDEAEAQLSFMEKYPHLLNTYIVQSGLRRTLHIYFEARFPVKSCKFRGGDLKAEGSYVVGAGSAIAGGTWQVVQDKPLYNITEKELAQILADFGAAKEITNAETELIKGTKTVEDFQNIYRFLVKEYGKRNEALFRVGCLMRDSGYNLQSCIEALAKLHATQRSLGKYHPENYEQRWAEAVASLRSAFSQPARNQREERLFKQDASYIPNSLREAILGQSDGAAFLRVYEGLLLTGLSADELITEAEIKARLSEHGIGRPSIRKALRFRLIPSPRTPPTADADLSLADSHTKTCVFVPKTKGDRSKHRPPKYYCIPSIETLCQILGVKSQGADPIELQDIRTSKAYRAALNRELIRRRPTIYSQDWLGKRLGVSSKSIQRYVKMEQIKSIQILHETPIFWGNVNLIPSPYAAKRAGFDIQPYFLQDDKGKRYPPLPVIAQKLLKTGHSVSLFRRDCKKYWLEEDKTTLTVQERFVSKTPESSFTWPQYTDHIFLSADSTRRAVPVEVETIPEAEIKIVQPFTENSKAVKAKTKKIDYRLPLDNSADEWLAQKLFKAAKNLMKADARRLVILYGRSAVGKALGRMEYLREKGGLENPAGFLIVATRVVWLSIHGFCVEHPKYQPIKRRSRHIKT